MTIEQNIDIELTVPSEHAGGRLDRVAAALFEEYSRALVKRWIEQGDLRVDGAQVKPRKKLLGGEKLVLQTRLTAREDWQAAELVPFDVVYEDDDVLVINKPAGVVVHPGAGNRSGTLVNGLLRHRADLALLPRAGIVHRLDKDTSGLLLVAANLPAQGALSKALAARTIERRYQAVAEGVLVAGRDVDLPVGRHPRQRTRQAVREDGKPALTRIRLMERFRAHCLVEAQLATGRTHQIRVHMAAIGHPLVGDTRYGARRRMPPSAQPRLVECLQQFPRQALHAWQLGFAHPGSARWLEFEAPPPKDFRELVSLLRADNVEGPNR